MNNQNYEITISGCKRQLPICRINQNLSIAAFIMFGDVEITQRTASDLLKKCPEYDILVTAEAKGIPICYEMARQQNKDYAVARKTVKLYMKNPISVEVKSLTTENIQKLYFSESDVQKVQNKRVLLVDDVISTGESLIALEKLVNLAKGNIVGKACVLAEGNAAKRNDIIFLEALPVF